MPAEVSQRIDGHRLWQRLMDLARFGATSKGGVCRLALSREDIEARAALVDWARLIGLKPSTDAVTLATARVAVAAARGVSISAMETLSVSSTSAG